MMENTGAEFHASKQENFASETMSALTAQSGVAKMLKIGAEA